MTLCLFYLRLRYSFSLTALGWRTPNLCINLNVTFETAIFLNFVLGIDLHLVTVGYFVYVILYLCLSLHSSSNTSFDKLPGMKPRSLIAIQY